LRGWLIDKQVRKVLRVVIYLSKQPRNSQDGRPYQSAKQPKALTSGMVKVQPETKDVIVKHGFAIAPMMTDVAQFGLQYHHMYEAQFRTLTKLRNAADPFLAFYR
jgi:hypothetical protein